MIDRRRQESLRGIAPGSSLAHFHETFSSFFDLPVFPYCIALSHEAVPSFSAVFRGAVFRIIN